MKVRGYRNGKVEDGGKDICLPTKVHLPFENKRWKYIY